MKTFIALVAALCLFGSTASAQYRPPVVVQRPVIVNGPVFFPPYGRPFAVPPVMVPPQPYYVRPFLYPYPPPVTFGFTESFRFRSNGFGFQYQFGRFGWSGWSW